MSKNIVLYGLDGSQPCRTVSWLLRIHKVDFEYETVMPGKGTRTKEFLSTLNRFAAVPVLKHGDFTLSESGAIVIYLADTFGWKDVYPDNLQTRAQIQAWMHWMHRNSREFTIGLFAPIIRPDLKFTAERIEDLQKTCALAAKVLDEALAKSGAFLVPGRDQPTLADFAIFADVGQCSKEDLDLFDFKPFPHLEKWVQRMKTMPAYEETHQILGALKSRVMKAKKSKI